MEVKHEVKIERFTLISGHLLSPRSLSNYNISDPNSEVVLKNCKWIDFKQEDAVKNSIVTDTDFFKVFKNKYTLKDLKEAVRHFCDESEEYEIHEKQMEKIYKKVPVTINPLTEDEKKGCALALSYYTGAYSDSTNRNQNAVIRGKNSYKITERWSDGPQFYPIIYYLTKAITNLPFYWGFTIRGVELTKDQQDSYQPGTVVTWLQWSSSSMGTQISQYASSRNTRFIIYSLTSRDISMFSRYKEEREALYPPYSHFLTFKRENKEGKLYIYLRQIEIGLFTNNILWTDDNIFNADWENKRLMEIAYSRNKALKIIPKISTETAIAFLESLKSTILEDKKNFRIISDMTRKNENPSKNAGARLVKELQNKGFESIDIMIFTSDSTSAINKLKELGITLNEKIKVTTSTKEAIKFLVFN